ncbi:MAG: non-canonical purine NTP pyrophosphatase [Pseudomonadota bacterium]
MRRVGDRLVLASHNRGKLREIEALVTPFGIAVSTAAEHGLSEPVEDGTTFAANARLKAGVAARGTGLPALSDDSGLEVTALSGRPGVYTADWAETGHGRSFPMAMTRVWRELNALDARASPTPPALRTARFVCTLCLMWPDGENLVFEGAVEGHLVWPMRGTLGFGFDPVFQPNGRSETFGEIPADEKHAISHRAVAFAKLKAHLADG